VEGEDAHMKDLVQFRQQSQPLYECACEHVNTGGLTSLCDFYCAVVSKVRTNFVEFQMSQLRDYTVAWIVLCQDRALYLTFACMPYN